MFMSTLTPFVFLQLNSIKSNGARFCDVKGLLKCVFVNKKKNILNIFCSYIIGFNPICVFIDLNFSVTLLGRKNVRDIDEAALLKVCKR